MNEIRDLIDKTDKFMLTAEQALIIKDYDKFSEGAYKFYSDVDNYNILKDKLSNLK